MLQKKTMLFEDKRECSGCTACYSVCPVNAIKMVSDEEGFLYPVIEKGKCIKCKKCIKICPFKKVETVDAFPKAYAARINDKIELMNSSSGGMFTALSDQILENGGMVVSAVYNYENHCTEFRMIVEKSLRNKARGSKYMQSIPGDIFRKSKEWLIENFEKKLIFFGMGCQAAGYKKYIESQGLLERVYIVDIICHGVPSSKMWRDYIDEKAGGKKVNYVTFKDKRNGWNKPFAFAQIEKKETQLQDYVNIFYNRCALRPSCYVCPYATVHRESDITIGDFWGIENVLPDFYNEDGNSLILVHSDKGMVLLGDCMQNISIQEVSIEDCLQPNLVAPTQVSIYREQFWRHYMKNGIRYIIKKYGNMKKKSLPYRIVRKVMNVFKKVGAY